MKIDLSKLDLTQFMAHDHFVNGEVVTLVQPQHIGTKWTQDNKHLRSSVWNYQGELISAGFSKFTNFGENPEHFPVPQSLKNCTVVEKLDGSLLIVSKYKGQYILRTRGTVDASTMANGHELELFKEKFLKSLTHDTPDTWNVSLLFEWVSPINKIVLNYGDEPDWYIVGIVKHSDYSLFTQSELDMWSKKYGFKRPVTYTFSDVNDLLQNVEQWKGKEGVVIYSHDGQMLHKVKSADYLIKHRFKSEATLENTLELYFTYGKPLYQEFESKLVETFDYECFEMVRGYASQICDSSKEVNKIVNGFQTFIDTQLKQLPNRKEQAQKVLSSFGQTNRASFVFAMLDGKLLSDEQLKKLFWQVLKN